MGVAQLLNWASERPCMDPSILPSLGSPVIRAISGWLELIMANEGEFGGGNVQEEGGHQDKPQTLSPKLLNPIISLYSMPVSNVLSPQNPYLGVLGNNFYFLLTIILRNSKIYDFYYGSKFPNA